MTEVTMSQTKTNADGTFTSGQTYTVRSKVAKQWKKAAECTFTATNNKRKK